jgi:hypothetical protein
LPAAAGRRRGREAGRPDAGLIVGDRGVLAAWSGAGYLPAEVRGWRCQLSRSDVARRPEVDPSTSALRTESAGHTTILHDDDATWRPLAIDRTPDQAAQRVAFLRRLTVSQRRAYSAARVPASSPALVTELAKRPSASAGHPIKENPMRRLVTILLSFIALLAAPAVQAQRGGPPAPPVPTFRSVDCADVRIRASNQAFIVRCRLVDDGTTLVLPVAQGHDYTGKYPNSNLDVMRSENNDAWRTQTVSAVVTTFYLARLNPDFDGILRLRVFDSLIGFGQVVTVVDAAEIVEAL